MQDFKRKSLKDFEKNVEMDKAGGHLSKEMTLTLKNDVAPVDPVEKAKTRKIRSE